MGGDGPEGAADVGAWSGPAASLRAPLPWQLIRLGGNGQVIGGVGTASLSAFPTTTYSGLSVNLIIEKLETFQKERVQDNPLRLFRI